jgi:transcriptional regulator with XRE-family HTH domain
MAFYDRVKGLCEERGISISALVRDLGFSASAGTTWKASKQLPRPATIKKVADYFNVSAAYLSGKTEDRIDYTNLDTSGFNLTTYDHILKKCKGNVEQANREYLEFEKAQAQDALNDPNRAAIYQNNGGTVGVQGHARAPVSVNGKDRPLSEQESELLRIFAGLNLVEQSRVLVFAAELKDKKGEGQNGDI